MKNSVNIQIIKNIHKVLSQSLNQFLTKSKKNKKTRINNKFYANKTNKHLKGNITTNTFDINEERDNPIVKNKKNNYSDSYFLIKNKKLNEKKTIHRNSNYLNKQNKSNIIRRNSNMKYLFDNYQILDNIQSSRSNYSYLNIKAPTNKRKMLNNKISNSKADINMQNNKNTKISQTFNNNNANKCEIFENNSKDNIISKFSNIKEFEDRKVQKNNSFKQKESINSKSSTSFSSINIKKAKKEKNYKNYKPKLNNKNINNYLCSKKYNKKKINIKKTYVLNKSPPKLEIQNINKNENDEINISDNNNENNNNSDINKNDNNIEKNINDIKDNNDNKDNNRENIEKKEEKNISLVNDKEEKEQQLNFLTKIKLDSIFGIGDYEIKNDNQDSLFIMTNNSLIKIFQNNINNYNFFFEENKIPKNNLNKNNFIIGEKIFTFLGICDGHGDQGRTISNYISTIIPTKIKNYLYSISKNEKEFSKEDLINELDLNIKNIFSSTNTKLNSMQIIDTSYSGSCFCSLLITKSSIISINLGNSKAIIGYMQKDEKEKIFNFYPYNLTYDHTPLIETEKERIIENGGVIRYEKDEYDREFGPLKIWKKNLLVPGLITTRNFGDKEASLIGVISEPDIKFFEMKKEYKFFVVGSFGLWSFLDSEECVKTIGKFYLKNDIDGAVNEIMKSVKSRWIEEKEEIIEDISIIVGFLEENEK